MHLINFGIDWMLPWQRTIFRATDLKHVHDVVSPEFLNLLGHKSSELSVSVEIILVKFSYSVTD